MSSNATTITVPAGEQTVHTVREFDAPATALFHAHIDPDLYAKWVGLRGNITMEQFDARPGGQYRWSVHHNDFNFSFHGVFHTVDNGELLVQTFEFSGAPGIVGISTAKFTDLGNGRTRLEVNDTYPSISARDAAVATGMTDGMEECYAALAELTASAGVKERS